MQNEYFHPGESITVTSCLDKRNGEPRLVYVVFNEREQLFLTSTMRVFSKSRWSKKIKRAAQFIEPDNIAVMLQQKGFNVKVEL